jgi:hypothetical protein
MPQRTTKQATKRAGSPLNTAPDVQLQRTRRQFSSRGNDQATRQAAALTKAFDVGVDFVQKRTESQREQDFLSGSQAATEGRELSADESRTIAFMRGFDTVMTEQDMAIARAEIDEEFATLDTSNMSAEDARQWYSERMEAQFGGLDPENEIERNKMKMILPMLAEGEQTFMAAVITQQKVRLEADLDAAFEIATKQRLADGTFDLEELNKQTFSVYGKRSNQEIFDLVTGIAIEQGRPDLLVELQQKMHWEGGATAPGGDSEFTSKIQQAIQMAESRAITVGDRQERSAARVQKKLDDDIRKRELSAIINPDFDWEPALRADDLLREGISPSALESLYRFNETVRADQLRLKNTDPESVLDIEMDLYRGYQIIDGQQVVIEDPLAYVMEYANTEQAGSGDAKLKNVSRLLGLAERATDERFTDPKYRNVAAQVSDRYPVSKDVATQAPNATEQALARHGLPRGCRRSVQSVPASCRRSGRYRSDNHREADGCRAVHQW